VKIPSDKLSFFTLPNNFSDRSAETDADRFLRLNKISMLSFFVRQCEVFFKKLFLLFSDYREKNFFTNVYFYIFLLNIAVLIPKSSENTLVFLLFLI